MFKRLSSNQGSALLMTLLIMLMLTLIFAAVVSTSVTDIDIAKNQKERTSAFYTAEAGLQCAIGVMRTNFMELNNDTLESWINASSTIGDGDFSVGVTGTTPFKTLTSTGTDRDGEAIVQVTVRRKRTALCIWDNIVFAGTGEGLGGGKISGNASMHGSVHLLGKGLTPDDVAMTAYGAATMHNNYTAMNATLSSRVPPLDTITFNGEVVSSLGSELRVKHGRVDMGGWASLGFPDDPGGSPPIKETLDGTYVTDGFGGEDGASYVYSDNGISEGYDLGDELEFPSLYDLYTDPNTGTTYPTYLNYLESNALVINGNLALKPGDPVSEMSNEFGSISMDASGNLDISGIVYVTGDIQIFCGKGQAEQDPVIFDGRGTLVSEGDISVDIHVLSKGMFPTDDVLGFIAADDIILAEGAGTAHLDITAAFFAQDEIVNYKQNQLAGAMVSNYFKIDQVPYLFQVPSIVENLPPGMPGSETINIYTYRVVNGTWREL